MSNFKDGAPENSEKQDTLTELLNEPSHTYIEKGKQLEDVTSTAWVFTLLGAAGILLIVILWTNLLPLNFSMVMKCMITVVMGGLFIFFLIMGIKAFHGRKLLVRDKANEEVLIHQIMQWFQEHYSEDAISNGMDEEDISIEQLYFLRSENIIRLMAEQFPGLEESFSEYMTEKIYQMYFPD